MIQDFPAGAGGCLGHQAIIRPKFHENCMKMKKIDLAFIEDFIEQ